MSKPTDDQNCCNPSTNVSRRSFVFGSLAIVAGSRAVTASAAPTTTKPPKVSLSKPEQDIAAEFAGMQPKSWGLEVPGVATRIATNLPLVALTFDGCGGSARSSQVDSELLEFLSAEKIKATCFLNSRWMNSNPKDTAAIAKNPSFDVQNHGTRHLPLSVNGQSAYGIAGTISTEEVVAEVMGNHRVITELTGRAPKFFRSGTAHYDEVAVKIVGRLGERVIGFSVNADAGATAKSAAIARSLRNPAAGTIAIAHLNHPEGQTFEGFVQAVASMRKQGMEFVHLTEVEKLLR
jgi:peptidoglycan/xylan/chitin deacetylase (PgdA/CDA1 family)